ncbi:MAG: hypothetical protein MUE51_02880 [Thermoleophilia bacterium]|jgi:hypothetical protein|nr:hypothetical protein [Thermoleophilia bacterium]
MTPSTPRAERSAGRLLRLVTAQGAAPAELVADVAIMTAEPQGETPERALARMIPTVRRLPEAA